MLARNISHSDTAPCRTIDELRLAIRANRVNFPVPVPTFSAQFRPDIQWRLIELYFVRGWSSRRLADRYGVTSRRVQQALQQWVTLASAHGYLQVIPVEAEPAPTPAPEWITAARQLPGMLPGFTGFTETLPPHVSPQPPA